MYGDGDGDGEGNGNCFAGGSDWAPVDGAFVRHYRGFSRMSIFSSVICVFVGFSALGAKTATPQAIFGWT